MSDNVIAIAVSYILPEIKGIPDLDERFRRACKEAHKFWLSTDDDIRFKAALSAVTLETEDPDQAARLERSATALAAVSRMLTAGRLDANIDDVLNFPEGFVPLRMLQIWMETKKEAT